MRSLDNGRRPTNRRDHFAWYPERRCVAAPLTTRPELLSALSSAAVGHDHLGRAWRGLRAQPKRRRAEKEDLVADGTIDRKRLPEAVQAILSNYSGAKVGGIPDAAIPDVLVRLARAASAAGKMPGQTGDPTAVCVQLAEALEQIGRLEDVG